MSREQLDCRCCGERGLHIVNRLDGEVYAWCQSCFRVWPDGLAALVFRAADLQQYRHVPAAPKAKDRLGIA